MESSVQSWRPCNDNIQCVLRFIHSICLKMSEVLRLPRKSDARSYEVLHLPRKTVSEPSKVIRACGVFNILTWKCASRHNGVHFFDISTSKSALFAHFDFQINVLRATTPFNFSSLISPGGSAPAALASLLFDSPEPQIIVEKRSVSRLC